MDFSYSVRTETLRQRLLVFMDEKIYPNEPVYTAQLDSANNRWKSPPIMEELKRAARAAGLWNLFLPDCELGVHNDRAGSFLLGCHEHLCPHRTRRRRLRDQRPQVVGVGCR